MVKIEQLTSFGKQRCNFAERCLSAGSSCLQTTIDIDPAMHETAESLGLKPKTLDDSYIDHRGAKSGGVVCRITVCPAAAHNEDFTSSLRSLLTDLLPEVYEDNPERAQALQEVQGVVKGTIDPNDVVTDLGLTALEKFTAGELDNAYPTSYKLTEVNGTLERINIYDLEEAEVFADG